MQKHPLWNHQKQAIEFAKNKKEVALLFDVGTGKTRTAIEILIEWYSQYGDLQKTLIFCPPIVVQNWKNEFLKYSDIPGSEICLVQGKMKDRSEIIKSTASRILVTNYESILDKNVVLALHEWRPHVLIADEMHRLKNPTAKRTKAIVPLAGLAERRIGLTGTPVLNSELDIFSQWRFLDGGETFGKNFFTFRNRYFVDKNSRMPRHIHFPDWVVKPTSRDEISAKIASKAMAAKKSDCLDLPPLLKIVVEVEMDAEMRKFYRAMKEDCVALLNNKIVSAPLAITSLIRLQQVCSGYSVTDDTKDVVRFANNPKAHALKELLEQITPNNKVIVWCAFIPDYDTVTKVCDDLKIETVMLTGKTSPESRVSMVEAFENDPKVRVLIAHPASAGEGINLVSASYSIYYSRNFNLGHYLQSEARNYRAGSERHSSITHIDLVMRDSIDADVLEAVRNKEDIAEKVIQKIKNGKA